MVFDDIADSARLIVKRAAALHAEILRHGDLHALNVISVPESFHEGVGEAEDQHVMYGPFAKEVVDAKNCGFVKDTVQHLIQVLRGLQIASKGLFHDDARAFAAASGGHLLNHAFKQERWDGQIKRRMLRSRHLLTDLNERRSVVIFARDVAQQAAEFGESYGINTAVLLQTFASA